MNKSLSDKLALVTGGSRGIGAAIARKLAHLGIEVVITGRDQPRLAETVREIQNAGGTCESMLCDVSSLSEVETLLQNLQPRISRLGILVNNAGVGAFSAPLHQTTPESWEKIMNTNLRGVFYMMRTFTPALIANGGGDIVNISSIASKNALPNGATYAASKWGLNGLSYSAAEELRAYNIRVTVVCPGSTNTDLSPHTGKSLSKMLQPDDVAHVVAMIVTQAPQSFASEVILRPTQKP